MNISTSQLLFPLDSTAVTLGASATFTGGTKSAAAFRKLCASVYVTTTGGTMYIEQSADGTNWDVVDSVAVTAGTPAKLLSDVYLPLCRIRYVNGAGAQGVFRLQFQGLSI